MQLLLVEKNKQHRHNEHKKGLQGTKGIFRKERHIKIASRAQQHRKYAQDSSASSGID
jgi:hypothetical protein